MILNLSKMLFLLTLVLFLKVSALAVNINQYGDFSSRSLIINQNKEILTQEEKNILISKKLQPNVQCLIQQIKKGNVENVKLLLNAHVNPNTSYYAEYPIYIAAKTNSTEIVELLLKKGAKLNLGFNSELYEAVKNKNTTMANLLIDHKANINYIDSVTENTILYMALKNNMLEVAQRLIDIGISPDKKSVLFIKKKKLIYLIKDKI